jgi:hypothetical protein
MNQYFGCNCVINNENNNNCFYCDEEVPEFCNNCKVRLQKMEDKLDEPDFINKIIIAKLPWGNIKIPIVYKVPPIPENTLKKYYKNKNNIEIENKRQEWYENNAFEIHTIIDLILSENKNKKNIGYNKMKILTNNSEEINEFFQYYIDQEYNNY